MQLSIYTKTPDAAAISHLLAKNPANRYERMHKEHAVRFVYHTMTDDELYATIFVTPNALALVNDAQAPDITHYINDREFAVSSIFLSLIRSALATALNGKPKEPYERYVTQAFPFTFEIGPVATELSDAEIEALWQPLGYDVHIEAISTHKRARFLTLSNTISLQQALQQIFILIPVMDDYKHYFIDDKEQERLQRYGEGWLAQHPQRAYITKKALRFRHLWATDEQPITTSLNTQRYDAIAQQVAVLQPQKVIDMGAGEGKLTERLAMIPTIQQLYAVDPSTQALAKMHKRFADKHFDVTPQIQWGSLYYEDDTYNNADVIVLCEVIEHIDEERLAAVMTLITERYAPQHMLITTPNAEYNTVYALPAMRHDDHRFEWTRAQFEQWCQQHAPQYEARFMGIGEYHREYGTPTQMCLLTRRI